MNKEIKYIELKTGNNDDGPAWIGKVEFSKSGKCIYFNGHALLGNGHGLHTNFESGDTYWVSGIKKNGMDRHRAGKGKIMIDRELVGEYLNLLGIESLDPNRYQEVRIEPTDRKKFSDLANKKLK